MAGWFELSKSSDNQFRFVLKAGNGETILTSVRIFMKGDHSITSIEIG